MVVPSPPPALGSPCPEGLREELWDLPLNGVFHDSGFAKEQLPSNLSLQVLDRPSAQNPLPFRLPAVILLETLFPASWSLLHSRQGKPQPPCAEELQKPLVMLAVPLFHSHEQRMCRSKTNPCHKLQRHSRRHCPPSLAATSRMQRQPILLAAAALLLLALELPLAKGYIHAVSEHNTSMEFSDLPAVFGNPLPQAGLMGLLVEAKPADACRALEAPPANSSVFIALIQRYNCSFDRKVYHAQQSGFLAAVVHNVDSDELLNMVWDDEELRRRITIPSIFTGETAATYLRRFFTYKRGGHVILIPEYIFPLGYYLIPFTGVVSVVIAVMCTILIVRCIQHRKRMRKDRLSRQQLKKIPVHTARKGDQYDVCAICLEEYEDGDQLRILPCSHAYHCKCVDPWLTRTKKTCPVCKQRVTRSPGDSESESEEGPEPARSPQEVVVQEVQQQEEEEHDSERTPLLRATPSVTPAPPRFGSMARSPPASPPPCPCSQGQPLV